MAIKLIEDRLKIYKSKTVQEEYNAFREIAQEIALCGLARTNFFKHVSFIGGSCLRIIHGLQRFSEDLDFWTFQPDPIFAWQTYLKSVQEEFKMHAFDMIIEDRDQVDKQKKRAFLKKDSIGKILTLYNTRGGHNPNKKLTIKFEIDTKAPAGSIFESKSREFPSVYPITVLDRSSLFASKIGALFDRKKEKGRHWYDFAWSVFNKWPINFQLLGNCLNPPQEITLSELQRLLAQLIESIDWQSLKKDVRPFLSLEEQETLNLWGKQYFLGYVDGLEYLQPTPFSIANLIADGKGKQFVDKVREALAAGALVDDDTRNGHRPLQMALSKGESKIAQLLIEYGADVNHRDRSGQTPLQAAINHGEFEIAKLLIRKGAHFNPNAPNLGFHYPNLYQFLSGR